MPNAISLPGKLAETYERLKQVRASKTVTLKPTPMLRTEIVGFDGQPIAFRLRYYQTQGIFHLITMKRMILGDGTGLGKTVEMIGALCYLWERTTDARTIIVSPKSAIRQWGSELQRFAKGVKVYVVSGKLEDRKATYEAWANHPLGPGEDRPVLILNYHILVRDWMAGMIRPTIDGKPDGKPDPKKPITPGLLDRITKGHKTFVVYDECTAFKNTATKTHQVCKFLSDRSERCYGLTATLLKNNLMEGFAIYKVIHPTVFSTKTKFLEDYCVTKMMPVGKGRQIPIVVGYRNLQHFRETIDPYFLGRAKHQVSDELPKLLTKEVKCELYPAEVAKYREALNGIIELGDGEIRDFEEHKALVALTYCQQVVDSLTLLKFKGGDEIEAGLFKDELHSIKELGSKEQALVDLFEEELDGEKTIVYTRFASLVPRLQKILAERNIKSVAIAGYVQDTEKRPDRQRAQQAFQDPKSDVQVIFITDAGSEAINLQAAAFEVFYDAPWSWGNYVQLLGRPIRIGSPHQHVVAIHLIAELPGKTAKERRTIDDHTLELLSKKKDLVDKVLGEAAVGALEFGKDNFLKDLAQKLKEDAKKP